MISSGRILALFAAGVLSLPASVLADNILVFGNYPSKNTLANSLISLGHTVDNQTGLPADLSGYDSIWHVDAGTPLTPAYQTQLADYLAAGGGVHLTGERPCCEPLNDSLQALVNTVVIGGGIQVGDLGDISGPYSINPSATSGLATTPNAVAVWVPSASGGMGGLGNLPDSSIFATGAGDVPVGGAWIESDMVSSSGRLTLLMDTNWFSSPGNGDNIAIIENIQHFLTSSGGVQPPVTGTARFLVTKLFEDGLTADVEVTLTCNAGLPLVQTSTISGGGAGVTFTLTEIPDIGADCSVTETAGPDNYIPEFNGGAGCEWQDVTSGIQSCQIVNVPAPVDFYVDVTWEISDDADDGIGDGTMLDITCTDGTDTSFAAGPDDLTDSGNVGGETCETVDGVETCTDDPVVADVAPGESCTASLSGYDSATVVTPASCTVDFTVDGGDESCSFTATAFYEGIPTLSQYGMAIMALLMLGIGFVGFRRFA